MDWGGYRSLGCNHFGGSFEMSENEWMAGDDFPPPGSKVPADPPGTFSETMHDDTRGHDNIERPAHYARFPIEPCTFIMTNELPYWAGNVVKYVCRAPYKGSEKENIRKAIRYCQMRIEQIEREEKGTTGNVVKRPL